MSVAVFTRPELSAPLSDADREISLGLTRLSRWKTLLRHGLITMLSLRRFDAQMLRLLRWGIEGIPANGQPAEVLAHHGLDAASLVQLILENRP